MVSIFVIQELSTQAPAVGIVQTTMSALSDIIALKAFVFRNLVLRGVLIIKSATVDSAMRDVISQHQNLAPMDLNVLRLVMESQSASPKAVAAAVAVLLTPLTVLQTLMLVPTALIVLMDYVYRSPVVRAVTQIHKYVLAASATTSVTHKTQAAMMASAVLK